MPLSAEIVRPEALTPADLRLWGELCDTLPEYRSPLLSPEFARTVGAVRSDARVAVLKRDGSSLGFLAYHKRPVGYARPIGAPFADYHGVIAPPEAGITLAHALAASGLRRYRHTGLIGLGAGQGAGTSAEGYRVDLTATPVDGHLEAIRRADAKRFKNWRRLSHKLEREQPDVTFGIDASSEHLARAIGWKRAQLRRSGLHDVLRPAWVERMMQSLFHTPDEAFGGLLLTLRVEGRPIAAHFGVRRGPVFHPWVAAFDPEFSVYSPGVMFLLRAIQAMPSLNLSVYDLSAGSDHYKKPLANGRTLAYAGLTSAAGPRPAPAASTPLATVTRRVRRRLEHIASSEPSIPGRVRGLMEALWDAPKRLGDAAADPT
jgi:CelD/BcsL family acetyltransferase involved in cellulose biosynthesis